MFDMQFQREFTAPMNALEAAQRAQYILGKWRYRFWSIPGGIRFERGIPGSALYAVRPHNVHAVVEVRFQELAENQCRVGIDQRIFKLGSPSSNLDKMVWNGDLDDLEASLTRREEPTTDRSRQDAYAGRVTWKYILFVVLPAGFAGGWFYVAQNLVGFFAMVPLFFGSILLLPFLPFRMPEFKLENAMPPFQSNYPRGRA